jgi:hypothetical protein
MYAKENEMMGNTSTDTKDLCVRSVQIMADGTPEDFEHWASRDDLGTAMQLGWTPPSPLYMLKMLLATRRSRREISPIGEPGRENPKKIAMSRRRSE